jgi:hypothetical protein
VNENINDNVDVETKPSLKPTSKEEIIKHWETLGH